MSNRVSGVLKLIFGVPQKPVSRREFISFATRTGLLGTSIGLYLWDRATRPTQTKAPPRTLTRNELLEQKVLGIVREVQRNQSMSARYKEFTSKIIELIEKREINFVAARNLGPSDRDFNAIYHPRTNTIEVDMADISSFSEVEFNAMLLHELFHAYQAWRGTPMKLSRMEAEAYLAEADYLYHKNHSIPDSWYAFVAAPHAKTLPQRFNVPISILKRVLNVPFESPQYKRAVETIGDNFLWSNLFRRFSAPDFKFALIAEGFKNANLSEAELRSTWKKVCKEVVRKPASAFKLTTKQEATITILIVSSQFYELALWKAGKKAETTSALQETFETFKRALSSTDISKLDSIMDNQRSSKLRGN